MLRFIIKHTRSETSEGFSHAIDHYTVDANVPDLEEVLRSGGYGNGSCSIHELIGVEVLTTDEIK